jgi:hypothetical protein
MVLRREPAEHAAFIHVDEKLILDKTTPVGPDRAVLQDEGVADIVAGLQHLDHDGMRLVLPLFQHLIDLPIAFDQIGLPVEVDRSVIVKKRNEQLSYPARFALVERSRS